MTLDDLEMSNQDYDIYVKIAYLIQHRHVSPNLANYFHLKLYEVTCFGYLDSLILSKYHFMTIVTNNNIYV